MNSKKGRKLEFDIAGYKCLVVSRIILVEKIIFDKDVMC